jgi:hypothetical protein
MNLSQVPPAWQGVLWGLLPFGSSIVAMLALLFLKDDEAVGARPEIEPVAEPVTVSEEEPVSAGDWRLMGLPAAARRLIARRRDRAA